MAQLGKDKASPIVEIGLIVNEVLGAARTLSRIWPQSYFRTPEQSQKHQERIEKYENIFWSMLSEEDEIKRRIEKAVEDMESISAAVISGKGSLYGILNMKFRK